MQKVHYTIAIHASAEKVFRTMLDQPTYQQWTAAFNPTSTFEGSWNKGGKIYFIGTDADGKKGGMIARIAENIPNAFISIQHYGMLDGDTEITEGPLVESWVGAFENYTFSETDGVTTVSVAVDTHDDYVDYFNEKWPLALGILKEICE